MYIAFCFQKKTKKQLLHIALIYLPRGKLSLYKLKSSLFYDLQIWLLLITKYLTMGNSKIYLGFIENMNSYLRCLVLDFA